ncbi:MAG: hypothetical protein HYZ28_11485 [Myxococcales bacterium]|nr:hypothetical protein [Myxococcales bacterium]
MPRLFELRVTRGVLTPDVFEPPINLLQVLLKAPLGFGLRGREFLPVPSNLLVDGSAFAELRLKVRAQLIDSLLHLVLELDQVLLLLDMVGVELRRLLPGLGEARALAVGLGAPLLLELRGLLGPLLFALLLLDLEFALALLPRSLLFELLPVLLHLLQRCRPRRRRRHGWLRGGGGGRNGGVVRSRDRPADFHLLDRRIRPTGSGERLVDDLLAVRRNRDGPRSEPDDDLRVVRAGSRELGNRDVDRVRVAVRELQVCDEGEVRAPPGSFFPLGSRR